MFGFIKNLFSGIAAFFSGLLNSKKSEDKSLSAPKPQKKGGFYLQLDESEDKQPAKAQSAVEAKKPEPAKAETPAPQPTPSKPKEKAQEPIRVELVQTATSVKAVPAEPAESINSNGQAPAETTFAPKYLNPITSSNSRRRPGANMSNFLDLARQVKTPGT